MEQNYHTYISLKKTLLSLTTIFLLIQLIILTWNMRNKYMSREVFNHEYNEWEQEPENSKRVYKIFKKYMRKEIYSGLKRLRDKHKIKIAHRRRKTGHKEERIFKPNETLFVYNLTTKVVTLKEIEKSVDNIFFIESKCGTHNLHERWKNQTRNDFMLSARQSCSVESAAFTNPSRKIYMLLTCPIVQRSTEAIPSYFQHLVSMNNVWMVQLNITEMFEGTPAEVLYKSGRIEQSYFPIEHSSDILRLTVLWRYGGTYLDLDVITIRSLDSLNNNFCGIESDKALGNAILNFEPEGYGHELLTKTLQHLNNSFDGRFWAVNGPKLITNIIFEECNSTIQTVENCTTFNVYNRSVLYPIFWKNHKDVFFPRLGKDIVEYVKKTGFTVHMWNNYTHIYEVHLRSGQAYALFAREFCPSTFSVVEVF